MATSDGSALEAKLRELEARLREVARDRDRAQARLDLLVAAALEQSVCLEFEPPVPTSLPEEEQVERMLDDAVVAMLNDFAARRFGGQPSARAMEGRRLMDFMARARDVFRAELLGFVRAGYHQERAVYRMTDAQGEEVDVELNRVGEVKDGHLVRMWSVSRDVTERRRRERRLEQARKLESLGLLAGGIAHDFNNLLAVLRGSVGLLRARARKGTSIDDVIDVLDDGFVRATDLVRQILTFSRRTELARRPTPLAPIVLDCVKLVRPSLPAGVVVEAHVRPCRDAVVDPTPIHQVVMNLVSNATQAIESAGRVDVTLDEATLDAGAAAALAVAPGAYARVEVRDTGAGMDARTREQIFDPFFTTKGRGTGLGLSVVHGVVTAHGGAIRVTSAPGAGARFEVLLPLAEGGALTVPPPPPAASGFVARGERLLVSDDDDAPSRDQRAHLTELGYAVVSAASADEALARFREAPESFDAIVLGGALPAAARLELARALTALRPGVPLLLAIDDADATPLAIARGAGVTDVLARPFPLAELAARLRAALAAM